MARTAWHIYSLDASKKRFPTFRNTRIPLFPRGGGCGTGVRAGHTRCWNHGMRESLTSFSLYWILRRPWTSARSTFTPPLGWRPDPECSGSTWGPSNCTRGRSGWRSAEAVIGSKARQSLRRRCNKEPHTRVGVGVRGRLKTDPQNRPSDPEAPRQRARWRAVSPLIAPGEGPHPSPWCLLVAPWLVADPPPCLPLTSRSLLSPVTSLFSNRTAGGARPTPGPHPNLQLNHICTDPISK